MVEQIGLEILYALGRMLYNPLVYWSFLLLFIAGARRVKRERTHFGVKIHHLFSEIRGTFLFSLIFGVIISTLAVLFGFVLSFEMIIVLAIITILLSLNGSFQLLSPAYTIGLTFIVFIALPLLPSDILEPFITIERVTENQFMILALFISLFLFIEALLVFRAKKNNFYPLLALSDRGVWLGEYQLKRMAVIPFIGLIPAENGVDFLPILPYFHYGESTFYLAIIPFIIGTQFTSRTEYMSSATSVIAKQKFILAFVILMMAIASYFYVIFTFVAFILAIIGTEWITYRNRMRNMYEQAILTPTDQGVKVIGTIPTSKAEELEILPGEIITKVNEITVTNSDEFYKALQQSGAFFKLDVIDENGELRFIKSAFYAQDHHDLGLLFPEAPYLEKHNARMNQLKTL